MKVRGSAKSLSFSALNYFFARNAFLCAPNLRACKIVAQKRLLCIFLVANLQISAASHIHHDLTIYTSRKCLLKYAICGFERASKRRRDSFFANKDTFHDIRRFPRLCEHPSGFNLLLTGRNRDIIETKITFFYDSHFSK